MIKAQQNHRQNGMTFKRPMGCQFILLLIILLQFSPAVFAASRSQSSKNSEPILKVKLGSVFSHIKVEFPDGGKMEDTRGRRVKTFKRKEVFSWGLPESNKRRSKLQYVGQIMHIDSGKAILKLNGKAYRGALQINFTAKGAKIVNHVGLEDYLRGVVGSEMGSLSPSESLKAQTVIARTYAYASRGKHGSDHADVCDSTHCQVYSGVSAERATIDAAVNGTQGIVMISDGEPIATLYHATCGGMTSDNDKVYGGAPRSYLRRVICPFCKNGHNYRWTKVIDSKSLRGTLAKEKVIYSKLYDADVESVGHMDRVDNLVLATDKGTLKIRGTTIRRLFNLPSTTFLTGRRKLPEQIVIAQKPLPLPATNKAAGSAKIMIAALMTDADEGPNQLFVQTAGGLKRAIKPEQGWYTIGLRQQISAEQTPARAVEIQTRPSNLSPKHEMDKIEIFGRGYGHQVGLCQSGAIELGKRNWSYRQILAFYYSNVALRSLDY